MATESVYSGISCHTRALCVEVSKAGINGEAQMGIRTSRIRD